MIPKLLHLDVSHKKSVLPNQNVFFRVRSTRLADSFEPLNSSLVQLAEELGHWSVFFRPKSKYKYIVRRFSKC